MPTSRFTDLLHLLPVGYLEQLIRYAFETGAHFLLFAEKVLQGNFAQHLVYNELHGTPERPDGAVHRVGAERFYAGMGFAELAVEKASAQHRDHLADNNSIGRSREPVSAGLPADALNEFPEAEVAHDLRDVGDR